jgi:dTDP-4-amino-4,6-dideoxygalactose transaminase
VSKHRIYLSAPHMGANELDFISDAFRSNWIAPLGPQVDAFESEFSAAIGVRHAAALSSGTAAIHLALRLAGVGPGDEVFCSTFTFVASANPIVYQGARPVFLDSEERSSNMDPELLRGAFAKRSKRGKLPKALILVHLYGQSADIDPIAEACEEFRVTLIEDAAEALGAEYWGARRPPNKCISPGTRGAFGCYSFNGNKIITTSGGGMLVSPDEAAITKARSLASQARDPAPHYQHSELGYNYRMSNLLAAVGRGQLQLLQSRVVARRRNFEYYRTALGDLSGLHFMPEASFGKCTRWLTCITVDPQEFGADCRLLMAALGDANIDARPLWKPLHLQPLFSGCDYLGARTAQSLFERGLCLPSGSNLSTEDLDRTIEVIRKCHRATP